MNIILSRELALKLNIPELQLEEIANVRQLPFARSTVVGFYIHRDDFPVWREAVNGPR